MSFLLRLGCALLASVGIAAAHGAVPPSDAAAHQPAQEHLAAAPEAPRETARQAPDASVRQARRAVPDFSGAVVAGPSLRAPILAFVRLVSPARTPAAAFAVTAASPRGPPASA